MKKDMEEREKKWGKWHKIMEEFQESEFKREEQMWEQKERMKASFEAFYNNQFKRDAELLTILRKR